MSQSNPTSLTRGVPAGGFATLAAAYLVFFVIIGGIVTWLLLAGPPEGASGPVAQTPTPPVSSPSKPDSQTVALNDSSAPAPPPSQPEEAEPSKSEPTGPKSVDSYDPDLVTDSPFGKLPVMGPNGKTAWQTYAQPFNPTEDGPRMAIIIEDLGLAKERTQNAIDKLPPEVTLSFSAYAQDLQEWADKARAAGHEVVLGIPMEPVSYPDDDPGPDALLTTLSPDQNIERLQKVLGRMTGYVGVVNSMGSKFTASTTAITPVLQDLSHRGLILIDSSATRLSVAAKIARSMDIPRAVNNRYIDNTLTPDAIDGELSELEKVAQGYGAAVGIGRAYPVTIDRLEAWIPTLKAKGILIAPITAVVNRQPIR